MSTVLVGSYPLGAINVGLSGVVTAVVPLLAQVDLMLTGAFGLGSLLADLSAQLNAALTAQIQLSLQVSNPFAALEAQLQAILQIQAGIAATLALGLPSISLTLTASLSASVAISATLALRVGGLQALISLALSIKLPLISLLASLNLSAGPFVLLSVGFAAPSTLASSITEYSGLVSGGVGGILPGDQVYGIIMLTKSPSASVALSAILKTS